MDSTEIKIGTKFITAEGREARVTNIKGDWSMVAVRLRPRHLVRKLWKLADVRAAVAMKYVSGAIDEEATHHAPKNPNADDEGNCIVCDGSGHDQNNDGQLCRVCGGAGHFRDDEDDA